MRTLNNKRSGFTLVELAIVLVIIGLLVGGVLVGQDLIKAAEVRSVVTFMEKTNAATNTFRGKFGGMPGDILPNRATAFGLLPATRDGTNGAGDGDGMIEADGGSGVTDVLGGENAMFWRDLSQTDLISQGFSTATDELAASLDSTTLPQWLPLTSIRESTLYHILVSSGRNYYYIDKITATSASGVITSAGDGLSPGESKAIDEKTDDGLPTTGSTIAVTGLHATTGYVADAGGAASATECVNTTATPDDYNVAEDYYNNQNCGIVVRASF
jgi:prepilin-type N-terminal cleavage/methylation domain-containing protein